MAVPVNRQPDGSLNLGAPVALFPTHFATGANVTGIAPQYEVTADGHFILNINKSDANIHPIGIVLDWPSLPKR